MKIIKDNPSVIIFTSLLIIFNCIVYYFYSASIAGTNGAYIFPLDDTYIHLGLAKNFALNNVWGMVNHEFCSSSSSPIFSFSLSLLIRYFGLSEAYPLIFDLVCGNLIFAVLYYMFKENPIKLLIAGLCMLTPTMLHIQVLSGMEHILHVLAILSAVALINKISKGENKRLHIYLYYGLVSLLCLIRYESMFFITGIIIVLILNKKFKAAILTAICGFLPIVFFGLYSMANGGYFFPNSLLVKGNIHDKGHLIAIYQYARLLVKSLLPTQFSIPILLMLMFSMLEFKINYSKLTISNLFNFVKQKHLLIILFFTLISHAMFATFGWLFRYEAYLVAMLYTILIIESYDFMKIFKSANAMNLSANSRKATMIVLSCSCLFLLGMSGGKLASSWQLVPNASRNIYQQQIQMSRFLGQYYYNSRVIANDIGAITYFNDIKLLDLVGLGSNSILKQLRSDKKYNENFKYFINRYPQNQYKIAIIYDMWFEPLKVKSAGWIKVGEWQIPNNVICGDDVVAFYATDSTEARKFKMNLASFSPKLPKDVKVTIMN